MSHFKSVKEALLQLLAVERGASVYAIGKNQETINLNKSIPLNGILDDSCLIGDTWEGIKVQKPDTLPSDAIIVNCSTSIAPISAERRIQSLHPTIPIIKYWEISNARPASFPLPFFIQEMEADYKNNRAKWDKIKSLLADKESLKVFDDITDFRLSGDYSFMAGYSVRLADQYFESFFELKKGEVFVDCGGFDGDTTDQFCKRCPEYGQVWFFEPSPANMAKAKSRLPRFHKIHFFQEGVSDQAGQLSFNPDAGSASSVSTIGDIKIPVTTIDAKIPVPVSFIKMDLEGWEMNALAGAKQCILDNQPKLAIAVYHNAADFWKIPELVLSMRTDYDLYLRHYTEGWSETVMYFIPKKQNG